MNLLKTMPKVLKTQDKETRALYRVLCQSFPNLPEKIDQVIYRYIPYIIWICIVDDRFNGLDLVERIELVSDLIEGHPGANHVSLMVLRTPAEMKNAKNDIHYQQFLRPETY